MDRVVSQLLAELSALNEGGDVFVIGATNRPDLIDPALLVPGRFDKLLYLGISEDKTSQLRIIKALTRKFNMAPNTSLEKIAEACPNNLTGADFYALCSDAMLNAIRDQVNQLEQLYETNPELISEYKKGNKSAVVQVEEKHFIEALNNLTPSVSKDELERYKQLRDKFTQKR
jgi:peroxin-6